MSDWLSAFPSKQIALHEGAHLFHGGDKVRAMFFVESGGVSLIRHHAGGAALVLQRAGPGSVLAEASLFADAYHCDAIATAETIVRSLPRASFLRLLETEPAFARAWAMHLSQEVRQARRRAEILSLRTVAERLDGWMVENGALPEKGGWKHLANEIGASPEALYREIAKRRPASAHRRSR